MEITVKFAYCGEYAEVKVTSGNSVIGSGLLDDRERKKLAELFRESADQLMYGIEEDHD